MYIGRNYLLQGKPELALEEIEKENVPMFKQFGLIFAYHSIGDKNKSIPLRQQFVAEYGKQWPYLITQLFAYTGEKKEAIKWLQRAFEQNDSWLVWIKGDPLLKNIWDDSAYRSVLMKMNLN